MKKIAILLIALTVALSYSCKKEGKKVQTSISGTLLTNGTNDPIKISAELDKPQVVLLHKHGGDWVGSNWDEIASTEVNNNAHFSFDLDLIEGDSYYIGFHNVDTSKYVAIDNWYNVDFFPVTPGVSNTNVKVYVLAHSWVRPRFINSNTNPNNNDVFEYRGGIGSLVHHVMGPYLYGAIDTTFSNSSYKTWSGTNWYGIPNGYNDHNSHKVYGKLTRNGVTTDVEIIYNVPPFDTTVVDIYY